MRLLLPLLVLTACQNDKGADDSGTIGACSISVESTMPVDVATDAYYRNPILFTLTGDAGDASVSLADSTGADVPGQTTTDGAKVWFTPDGPLDQAASYSATLSYCSARETAGVTFTTSTLGEALTIDDLVGRAYLLDLGTGLWLQPDGIGTFINSFLSAEIVLSIQAEEGATLDLEAVIRNVGATVQDTCVPTIGFPTADWSAAPWFTLGPTEADFGANGLSLPIHDAVLEGTFAADGSFLGGGHLSGNLDARDLAPTMAEAGMIGADDPALVCQLMQGFSVTCGPCTSDGEETCVPLEVINLVATEETGFSVEPVDQADCHEDCAASCDNAECAVAESFAICG